MRRKTGLAIAAALMLLAAGVGLVLARSLRVESDADSTGPAPSEAARVPAPLGAPLAAAPSRAPADKPAATEAAGAAAATTAGPAVAAMEGESPAAGVSSASSADADADADAKVDAVRRSPFAGPSPMGPARRVSTGGGSMGPTGHWTRYPPGPPPSGTARLTVHVLDEDGKPVPEAEVWLGPPDVAGAQDVSFGNLRRLGVTGATGALTAAGLPHGRAAVAANPFRRLNGPRGLDARTAVATVLRREREVRVDLHVPLRLATIATLEGKVADEDASPLRGVLVNVGDGYQGATTDATGAFRLRGLDAGAVRVSAQRFGFLPHTETLALAAGTTTTVAWTLSQAESGSLTLSGVVRGPDAEPVARASVYLTEQSERGGTTVRSAVADDAGAFSMRRLADRLADARLTAMADRFQDGYGPGRVELARGIPASPIEIRLVSRLTAARLSVVDAASGVGVARCRCTLFPIEPLQVPEKTLAASYDRPGDGASVRAGGYEGLATPGRYRLVVEPIDHRRLEEVWEIPSSPTPVEREVRLARLRPDSVEVALTVEVTSSATGAPVGRCRVEVLDGEPSDVVSRLDAPRDDGVYRLPALSAAHAVRVAADGFETGEEPLHLRADEPEPHVVVRLRPR